MDDARFIEIAQAAKEHGEAAAESRKGMAEPNLSGEWHDDFTPTILQREIGASDAEWQEIADDACEIWESAVAATWKGE